MDALFAEQDGTVDVVKRKQHLIASQEKIMEGNTTILGILRDGIGWHREYVVNYPRTCRSGSPPDTGTSRSGWTSRTSEQRANAEAIRKGGLRVSSNDERSERCQSITR